MSTPDRHGGPSLNQAAGEAGDLSCSPPHSANEYIPVHVLGLIARKRENLFLRAARMFTAAEVVGWVWLAARSPKTGDGSGEKLWSLGG